MSTTETTKVGSPSDVAFVDPNGYFGQSYGELGNEANYNKEMMARYGGAAYGAAAGYDPNAAYRMWLSQQPGLVNTATGVTAPYAEAAFGYADRAAANAIQAVNTEYGAPGMNLGRSSAADYARARAAGDIYAKTAQDIQEQMLGLYGNFSGQQMQNLNQNYQFAPQLAATVAGGLAGQYGGQYGSFMGTRANMAGNASGLWQPTYMQQDTAYGGLLKGLGTAADVATAGTGVAKAAQS